MNTWSPIWSGIVDSTLWAEDGNVVKVFMTMLATKDSDHVCRLDAYRMGRKCNIDELEVLEILKLLASPDKRRKSHQEFDGRRIRSVPDGWLILNGEKYREMVQKEMKQARWRRAQAKRRQGLREVTKAEVGYLDGVKNGEIDNDGNPIPDPMEAFRDDEPKDLT